MNTYYLFSLVGIPPAVVWLLSQLDIPSGLENLSGIAVLGYLCYIILTKVNKHLETLTNKLEDLSEKIDKLEPPASTTTTTKKGR